MNSLLHRYGSPEIINFMHIDGDIHRAHTLPAAFYREKKYFNLAKEKIFATSWLYAGDAAALSKPGRFFPVSLLPGVLDEPLVLTRDKDGSCHCLSNVCTHRGNIIATAPAAMRRQKYIPPISVGNDWY